MRSHRSGGQGTGGLGSAHQTVDDPGLAAHLADEPTGLHRHVTQGRGRHPGVQEPFPAAESLRREPARYQTQAVQTLGKI